MSKIDKLCNHFHISVQSLNDSVLKRMNRKYTSEFVVDRINKLREKFVNPGITCDIIVGFINETDEEFEDTLEKVKKIKFSDMHVFKFSKREGTVAYNMQNNVTGDMANKRSEMLIKIGEKNKLDFMKKFIGKKLPVLIDEEKNGELFGYTSNYIRIRGKGEKIRWGEIQDLEFSSIEGNVLI